MTRKCSDCKHCTDAVAVDTIDGGAIESNFDFYRRFVAAAVAAGRRSTVCRSTDSSGLIRDVDKPVRFVICRNHFVMVVPEPLVVAAVLAAGFVIYLALCER